MNNEIKMTIDSFKLPNFVNVAKNTDEHKQIMVTRDAIKKSALKFLLSKLADNTDEVVKSAVACLTPSRAGFQRGDSKASQLMKLFNGVGSSVSELDIFMKLNGTGRGEMTVIIREILKKAIPEARIWISFNSTKMVYTLVSIGKNPPANWTGYVPLDSEVIAVIGQDKASVTKEETEEEIEEDDDFNGDLDDDFDTDLDD